MSFESLCGEWRRWGVVFFGANSKRRNLVFVARSPPAHSQATNTRNKDRISYSHQLFQVDLTQVTTSGGAGGRDGPVSHELEIEFKDAKVLLVEGQKEQRGEENQYLEMVQCFLNNIRESVSSVLALRFQRRERLRPLGDGADVVLAFCRDAHPECRGSVGL